MSSTYTDLVEERAEVLRALLRMRCFPAGMELFPASRRDAWTFIKDVIDESDYYVVVIGGRYGSVDEEGVSFTEREYDYAVARQLPTLAFLHTDPGEIPLNRSEQQEAARAALAEFRKKVEGHSHCAYWRTEHELARKVTEAVHAEILNESASGWVRADALTDAEFLTTAYRLARLRERMILRPDGFDVLVFQRVRPLRAGMEVFWRAAAPLEGSRFEGVEPLQMNGAILLEPIVKFAGYRKFYIATGRQLAEGEELDVSVIEHFSQESWSGSHHHSAFVDYPMDELTLEVEPSGVAMNDVRAVETIGELGGGTVVRRTVLAKDEEGVYRVVVSKPTVGHAYGVEWSGVG